MVVLWQLICNKNLRTRFIYNLDPILVNFELYALYMLQQYSYVFFKHWYKQFVISDDKYPSAKAVMMELFQAI